MAQRTPSTRVTATYTSPSTATRPARPTASRTTTQTSRSSTSLSPEHHDEWTRTPFWHSFADVLDNGTLQLTTEQQAMLLSAVSSPQTQLSSLAARERQHSIGSVSSGRSSRLPSHYGRDSHDTLVSSPRSTISDRSDSCGPETPQSARFSHVNPQEIERHCTVAHPSDFTVPKPLIRTNPSPPTARRILPTARHSMAPKMNAALAGNDCIVIPMHIDDSDDDFY